MKRLHKTVASAFASACAATGRMPVVIASTAVELPQGEEPTVSVCAHCQTTAGYNVPSPHCITCGSDELEAVQDVQPAEEFSAEEDVVSAGCPNCGTHNLMSKATCASLDQHMHCAACGTEIDFSHPEDAGTEFDPTDSTDLEATGDEDDFFTEVADDDTDGELDTELDLVDQAEEADLEGLEVFAGNGKVYAAVNDLPIAVLDEEDAGDNLDVMQQEGFLQAVKASVKQQGFKALADLGFRSLKVKASIARIVDKQVKAATASETAKVTTALSAMRKDYAHAIQIAGVGLNKGFFANRTNALKAAFFDVLQQAGVRNAAGLVDTAFANAGEEYVEELLDTAEDVLEKSPEVRDEIAATLRTTNYQKVVAAAGDDDVEDDADEVVARAKGAGLKITASAAAEPTIKSGLFGR